MKKNFAIGLLLSGAIFAAFAGAVLGFYWQTSKASTPPDNLSPGVAIQPERMSELHVELEKRITSAPPQVMRQSGLAGAMGGIHVKVSSDDSQEILLPIPQLADGQVPVCYFISSTPPDAVSEYRLRKRDDSNVVVSVRFEGGKREVQIAWSSVILLARQSFTPNTTPAATFRSKTACVQSQANEISTIATDTWPKTNSANEFAANIQQYIRGMTRKVQPRSLDAVGIVRSGENGICTANANLASALMRSRGIACRSIAVIPPISQRLEMHRIVEFWDKDRWIPFDPSSLQAAIPAQPWQNIIMSKTTTSDEQIAMKPRRGSMVGCPYGQEVELLTSGVNLFGQDFFWTMAKPLAEFEPTEEAMRLAADAWNRFLETGALTDGQLNAASADTNAELVTSLK